MSESLRYGGHSLRHIALAQLGDAGLQPIGEEDLAEMIETLQHYMDLAIESARAAGYAACQADVVAKPRAEQAQWQRTHDSMVEQRVDSVDPEYRNNADCLRFAAGLVERGEHVGAADGNCSKGSKGSDEGASK